MLDKKAISDLEEKIIVKNNPFPHSIVENILPTEIVIKAENEFINFKRTYSAGNKIFQKTKKSSEKYAEMPDAIKKIIAFFNSKDFINILEKKFNLKNVEADWNLHGGGLHESFKGGFLKVHSDFIYVRKSKLRRVLNLLLYINSNWQKKLGWLIRAMGPRHEFSCKIDCTGIK